MGFLDKINYSMIVNSVGWYQYLITEGCGKAKRNTERTYL